MEFKTGPFTRRIGTFFSRWTTPVDAASPSVWDLTLLVGLIVVSVFVVSLIYDGGLMSQIAGSELQLRTLREQDATVQEQLAEQVAVKSLYEVEQDVPHPELKDRDLQSIGNHVDVSWEPPAQAPGRYVSYEVELTNLGGGDACKDQPGPTCVFLASDSRNSTSRIPAEGSLDQGRYVWRVAAVSTGTSLSTDRTINRRGLLSDWSAFASFTLYGSQAARIWATKTVRVGLDLGQGTVFAQRSSDGTIRGIEISLIYTLIEGCLSFDQQDHVLRYNRSACKSYISDNQHPLDITSRNHSCRGDDSHPCVSFVPIDKWGSYPAAVKRKEVDLFLGTATKAEERERSGLRFTSGYFPIETEIYGHAQDVGMSSQNLSQWLTRDRNVGAISGSTNAYVLDKLIKEGGSSARGRTPSLAKEEFDSFPSMEAAMDKGEIDGVIIDDSFVQRTDWVKISGLKGKDAWRSYLSRYVHSNREEYAIAVAIDNVDHSLYTALEAALRDGLVTRDKLALFTDGHISR
jgi:ABC-type amino acid transport substrate-binding protein